MEKKSLWLLLAAVSTCCYATETSDNIAFRAGRSQKELDYVKSKIKEIDQLVIKKLRGDDHDVPYTIDKDSRHNKNLLWGAIDDILLSGNDVTDWLDGIKGQRRKRGALYNFDLFPQKKWSMPIKYMIDTTTIVNKTSRHIIRDAIAAWEKETCVRFQEVFSDPKEKFLYFVNIKGAGCKSYIGKQSYWDIEEKGVIDYNKNKQPVFLEDPGCYLLGGIPMHEIGHALGLYHEAQRLDRDGYISINYFNIQQGEEANFVKPSRYRIDSKGVPYDIGSVMQYGALAFSNDIKHLKPVIIPYEREKIFVMGQRSDIGFYDAQIVNFAYCPDTKKYKNCYNHGYPDPHNTSQCKCPAQWTGSMCETLASSSSGCSKAGGVISHTMSDIGKTFSLMSPNYMNLSRNGTFTQGDHCFWKIEAPMYHQIVWWIDNTEVHGINKTMGLTIDSAAACIDWLEIRKPKYFRGRRICGIHNATSHSRTTKPTYSYSQVLYIDFRSFTNNLLAKMFPNFRRGFHLKYEIKSSSATPPTTTPAYVREWYTTRKRFTFDYWWRTTTTKNPFTWYWQRKTTTQDDIDRINIDYRKTSSTKHPWYWDITRRKTTQDYEINIDYRKTSSTKHPWYWDITRRKTTHYDYWWLPTTTPFTYDQSTTIKIGVIVPIGAIGGSILFFVFLATTAVCIHKRRQSRSRQLLIAHVEEEIAYPDMSAATTNQDAAVNQSDESVDTVYGQVIPLPWHSQPPPYVQHCPGYNEAIAKGGSQFGHANPVAY